jgi:hypothetical protein
MYKELLKIEIKNCTLEQKCAKQEAISDRPEIEIKNAEECSRWRRN